MKIIKTLSNSSAIIKDEMQQELVVTGKGISFGKKVGDFIDKSLVEKKFILTDENDAQKISDLLNAISTKNFELTKQLVDLAKEKLGKKLHRSIYLTLADHIETLEERATIKAYIKNTLLWDIRRLYKDEFNVALEIVDQLNKRFHSEFDENEAATITMHLINAELELDFGTTNDITKVMAEVMNIVKYHFNIIYNEESLAYYRFITHLRFFSQRLFTQQSYNESTDEYLIERIKSRCSQAYECANKIKDFLENAYNHIISDEEIFYLTIHIFKVVKESETLLN